jgi:hypothetical protein
VGPPTLVCRTGTPLPRHRRRSAAQLVLWQQRGDNQHDGSGQGRPHKDLTQPCGERAPQRLQQRVEHVRVGDGFDLSSGADERSRVSQKVREVRLVLQLHLVSLPFVMRAFSLGLVPSAHHDQAKTAHESSVRCQSSRQSKCAPPARLRR